MSLLLQKQEFRKITIVLIPACAGYVFSIGCFIGGTAILAVFSRAGSPCHVRKLLIQLSG